MDDPNSLTSRQVGLSIVYELTAAHQRLAGMALDVLDKYFPVDGPVKDDPSLPLARVAFMQVMKAKSDLESCTKSFAETMKAVEATQLARSPSNPTNNTTAANSTPTAAQSSSNITTEDPGSVGLLKKRFDALGPKKVGVSPPAGSTAGPNASPNAAPKRSALKQPSSPPSASSAPQSPTSSSSPPTPASKSTPAEQDNSVSSPAIPASASSASFEVPFIPGVPQSSPGSPMNVDSEEISASGKKSSRQNDDSDSASVATTGQSNSSSQLANEGGKSDDDMSSDEEAYLKGLEERRQRALAEKNERLAAAAAAREVRLGMYQFLNEEPPPGFISAPPVVAPKKSKKDKEKKKLKDKLSSSNSSPRLDSEDIKSGKAKAGTKRTERTNSKSTIAKVVPDSEDSNSLERRTSMTTTFQPVKVVDDSTWQNAEQSIKKTANSSPSRHRWEDFQARYSASREKLANTPKETKSGASTPRSDSPKLSRATPNKKHSKKHGISITSALESSDGSNGSPRPRLSNADDGGSTAEDSESIPTGSSASRMAQHRTDSFRKASLKLDDTNDDRVFLFEAPENESNLRLMDKNGEEVVAGGTIEKLIQRLTSHTHPSPEYFHSFMLTYHNFLTPQELIDLLRLRWNSRPADLTKLEQFVNTSLTPIRLRIMNVVKMWVETFGSDFKDDAARKSLQSMLDYVHGEYPQIVNVISNKLKKVLEGDGKAEIDVVDTPPPIRRLTSNIESILDIHPEEFARQMTLVEHALFKVIGYKELLTNAKAGKKNVNVSNMIAYTNHLVAWISTQIVTPLDVKSRAVILSRFITIAKFCINSCQNYNGAMEIISALRSASVFRMKQTWNMLPDNIWEDYEMLEDLFESDDNFGRYRAALSNAVPPCVPYLGRYLSEMLFLNEIHPDYLSPGPPPVINFAKMSLTADILQHLQRYQKHPFCLTGVPEIQNFFLRKDCVQNEKELYKVSLEREPREQ